MRRLPKQARSQRRLDHVLNTAANLIATLGEEAVTTNLIAERAGVSIGWLYQFFPNKESIIEALTERQITLIRAIMTFDTTLPLTVTITRMIDGFLQLEAQQLGLKQMLVSNHAPPDMHTEVGGRVDALLAAHFPDLPAERRWICALSGVYIFKGMLNLASPEHALSTAEVGRQISTALLAYLMQFLQQEGQPVPEDVRQFFA